MTIKRPDDLGYPDVREMKERLATAYKDGAKAGAKAGGLDGGIITGAANGMIEARRISREMNTYLHPTDAKRRAYYDQKRKERDE